MMVTHSMRQALDHGTRTVMLHEGKIIFDLSGDERASYDVPDLLNLFAKARGDDEELDDDKLLLGG
jgi:putative ABC transport system ATP-binding protein